MRGPTTLSAAILRTLCCFAPPASKRFSQQSPIFSAQRARGPVAMASSAQEPPLQRSVDAPSVDQKRQATSQMTRSTDLDLDPAGPRSNLDGSNLDTRKQKLVAAIDEQGAASFQVVLLEGNGGRFHWVVGETQGRRQTMEDAHVVNLDIDGNGTALFAVFDGHSGSEVAAFCAQHVTEELLRSEAFRSGDVEAGLRAAFLSLQVRMEEEDSREEIATYSSDKETSSKPKKYGKRDDEGRYLGPSAGSTAAVAVVHDSHLYVAHAGDSRVVFSDDGIAMALTTDHKPDDPREKERIERAGQFVGQRPGGVPRVGGTLAMSRAMGDVKYKDKSLPVDQQAVTAAPDTTEVSLAGAGAGDGRADPAAAQHPRLLILACDGLWDVMTRQMADNFLEQQLATPGGSLRAAVSALMHETLRPDSATPVSYDNVTVVVVQLGDV